MQDEDMLKKYLAEYYTKAMEQNYYNSLSPEVRKATKFKIKEEAQVRKTPTGLLSRPTMNIGGDIPIKGGIIRNGIFMPDKK